MTVHRSKKQRATSAQCRPPIALRLHFICMEDSDTQAPPVPRARAPPCSKFSERQGATHPLCYPIPSRERGRPAMFTKRFATSTRCLSLNRMRESKAFRCTLPALREDRLNSLRCWAERACALLTAFRDSPGVVLVARSPALRFITAEFETQNSRP